MKPLAILLLGAVAYCSRAADTGALTLTRAIPLPGVKGRFDHFAIDADGHRLFLAALGNNTLEVTDIASGKRVKSIPGLRKPTGVVFLRDLNQVGVANGDDGTFKLFDGDSYNLVQTFASLDDADNARHDAKTKLTYVGQGEGAIVILDTAGRKKLGDIKLPAHPESFQLEAGGPRIFVNVPGAQQIAVIDRETRAVVATWPMKPFKANFPMALDETNHRLFVGCRQPSRLVVLDTTDGKLVADVPISGDTDDLFHDPSRKRLYVSCGDGFIDVIEQRNASAYERIEKIPTRAGARTSFFSTERDEFYLAVPTRDGQGAEIRIYSPDRRI